MSSQTVGEVVMRTIRKTSRGVLLSKSGRHGFNLLNGLLISETTSITTYSSQIEEAEVLKLVYLIARSQRLLH